MGQTHVKFIFFIFISKISIENDSNLVIKLKNFVLYEICMYDVIKKPKQLYFLKSESQSNEIKILNSLF